jgi:NADH dehydrogenase (ubiquinone) 1 alpha subcomplex subunit 9
MVDKETMKKHRHINLPKKVLKTITRGLDYLWWPTLSPDQVERQFIDQKIDPTAKTFRDLAIEPTDIAGDMLQYIRHYRSVIKSPKTRCSFKLTRA